jgi:hypothetical protein
MYVRACDIYQSELAHTSKVLLCMRSTAVAHCMQLACTTLFGNLLNSTDKLFSTMLCLIILHYTIYRPSKVE